MNFNSKSVWFWRTYPPIALKLWGLNYAASISNRTRGRKGVIFCWQILRITSSIPFQPSLGNRSHMSVLGQFIWALGQMLDSGLLGQECELAYCKWEMKNNDSLKIFEVRVMMSATIKARNDAWCSEWGFKHWIWFAYYVFNKRNFEVKIASTVFHWWKIGQNGSGYFAHSSMDMYLWRLRRTWKTIHCCGGWDETSRSIFIGMKLVFNQSIS